MCSGTPSVRSCTACTTSRAGRQAGTEDQRRDQAVSSRSGVEADSSTSRWVTSRERHSRRIEPAWVARSDRRRQGTAARGRAARARRWTSRVSSSAHWRSSKTSRVGRSTPSARIFSAISRTRCSQRYRACRRPCRHGSRAVPRRATRSGPSSRGSCDRCRGSTRGAPGGPAGRGRRGRDPEPRGFRPTLDGLQEPRLADTRVARRGSAGDPGPRRPPRSAARRG